MKLALLTLAFGLAAASAAAGPRCFCLTGGVRVAEGQVACIRAGTAEAALARCERVLNNTSWTKLRDGCPQSNRSAPQARSAAALN
ncbi:MAG: hypothetical protein ACTHJ3_01985 [Pararhizobium sp.]